MEGQSAVALWERPFRGVRQDGQPVLLIGMCLSTKNVLSAIAIESDGTFMRYLASEVTIDWRYNVETDGWDDLNLLKRSESGLDRYEEG